MNQLITQEKVRTVTRKKIRTYPKEFEKHLREVGGLDQMEATVWLFHWFERNLTTLKSGSVVDYRKYAAELMNEDGALNTPSDLSSHKSAAVSKFREFQNCKELFSTTTTEGEEK